MKRYFITPIILQTIAIILLKPLFRFFLHWRIEGVDRTKNLPKGVIFATNHSSYFDAGFVPVALPIFSKHIPMFYVSLPHKGYLIEEEGSFIFRSFLTNAWGSYELVPGQKDYSKALINHEKILQDKGSLCIFPEGKISRDGTIGEAKGGIAYLAFKTGKPIVPIHIKNASNLTLGDFLKRKRTITITFGDPIYLEFDPTTDSNSVQTFKEKAEYVVKCIKSL